MLWVAKVLLWADARSTVAAKREMPVWLDRHWDNYVVNNSRGHDWFTASPPQPKSGWIFPPLLFSWREGQGQANAVAAGDTNVAFAVAGSRNGAQAADKQCARGRL